MTWFNKGKLYYYVSYCINTWLLSLMMLMLIIAQFTRFEFLFSRKLFRNRWRKLQRIVHIMPAYPVKGQIISPTTQIVFTESKLTNSPICVKVWYRQRAKEDIFTQILYFLEGFIYNQRNAPGVYLGLAYLEGLGKESQTFRRDRLTFFPRRKKLTRGEYGIVMRQLDSKWRLDCHLQRVMDDPAAIQQEMEFLAAEIARLHKRAKKSPPGRGTIEVIAAKLRFNREQFAQALEQLAQRGLAVEEYRQIDGLMEEAYVNLRQHFLHRHAQRHTKRCHGDLKLNNLWIRPAERKRPKQLLVLDCIDFNPDFCHIDTLSDVAMFIMDLQMHLGPGKEGLVEAFTTAYLREMNEDAAGVELLLSYYITEKAMVCSYVTLLQDNELEHSLRYLSLIAPYAERLRALLIGKGAGRDAHIAQSAM